MVFTTLVMGNFFQKFELKKYFPNVEVLTRYQLLIYHFSHVSNY
jgi:hypothetical protein